MQLSPLYGDQSMHDFSSLNLQQLQAQFDNVGDSVTMGFITEFTKRLIDITYFDRDTSIENREEGEQLIARIIPAFEQDMQSQPETLKAYQTAYQTQLSNVKYFGFGSLGWKVREPGVQGADVINIIVEPSSGPLIPDFLEVMSSEFWLEAKPSVIKTLILDRRRSNESNAVLILSGLVSGYDQVAWNVLTEDERNALVNVADNYELARNVLVQYDLLPKDPTAEPLTPALDVNFAKLLVIYEMREDLDFLAEPEIRKAYDDVGEQQFVSVLLKSLRLKLWMSTLTEAYGSAQKENIEQLVMAEFEGAKASGFESFLETLSIADNYRSNDSYFGPDLSIAAALYDWYIPKNATEDEELSRTQAVAQIVNYARVNFLHKNRFMLRYFAKYPPDGRGIDDELTQHIMDKYSDMYLLFGSRVPEAEQQLLFEDWIGYWNL